MCVCVCVCEREREREREREKTIECVSAIRFARLVEMVFLVRVRPLMCLIVCVCVCT